MQSIPQRAKVALLHEQLTDTKVEAELKADYDGDLFISIPTGFYQALEVDSFAVNDENIYFTLTRRAWDRTGGLSNEVEVGETNQLHILVSMVQADRKFLADQDAKLEAQLGVLTSEGEDQS